MIAKEVVRRKKSSSFASAFGFFLFLLLLISFGFLGATYIYRDRLILEYVRDLGPKAFGFEALAIDSLLTRPVGQISMELRGVVFKSSPEAPLLRAERVLISTPRNLLGLYQLTFSREALPLKLQLSGLKVQTLPSNETSAPGPAELSLSPKAGEIFELPFPIELETELREAQVQVGRADKPFTVRNITGVINSSIEMSPSRTSLKIRTSGQLSMGIGLSNENFLPVRTDWAVEAEPQLSRRSDFVVQITSLTVSALGMKLSSRGNLKWPEQSFSISMLGSTTDLGVLPLEAAESQALGLSGRLKGSADLDITTAGRLGHAITSRGLLRIRQGVFPFNIEGKPTQTASIKGPVQVDIEAPFDITFDMSTNSITNLKLQTARLNVDLTETDVQVEGILRKPSALMMALKTEFNADGDTIDVSQGEFRLANFLTRVSGKISMDPKRTSKLDIIATLPSLAGWPRLLPILGQVSRDGLPTERIDAARGSIALKVSVEAPLSQPDRLKTASKFVFETFEISNFELPFNNGRKHEAAASKDQILADGVLRGRLSAVGSVELSDVATAPFNLKLQNAKGFLDLTDIGIVWKNLVSKKRAQPASVEFVVRNPSPPSGQNTNSQVQVDRFDVKVSDSSLSIRGLFQESTSLTETAKKIRALRTDSKIETRLALSQLYDVFPVVKFLRSHIPSGTLTSNLSLRGTLRQEPGSNPFEASPLSVQGSVGLIGPRAIFLSPSPKPSASSAQNSTQNSPNSTEVQKPFSDWPIFKQANLKSDFQFASVALKTTEAKGLKGTMSAVGGRVTGAATVQTLFGGSARIDSLAVDLGTMSVKAQGSYQDVDLSALGEYFDPKWKTVVGGKSSGPFKLEKSGARKNAADTASSAPLIDTISVSGNMKVKDGFFSTESIDQKINQMINQRLTENPQIAKLIGAPKKVKTGGAKLDMTTAYSFTKSVLNLSGLVLLSPEKNEVRLSGWVKPDLSVDLKGTALLMNTPIGGSFRQANSDASGRLVVPLHITGLLTKPSLSMAEDIIASMVGKTVRYEADKARSNVGKEAIKVIDKTKNDAIDAVKEELKKRGLSF